MKVSMHLGKKLSVRHNLRDYEEGKWNRDGHINRNLSYKNAVFFNIPLIDLFKEIFEKPIEEFDSKQRHAKRRIGSYEKYYNEQKGKAQEMILQVGNADEQLTEEQYLEFFYKAFLEFQRLNPTLVVFHASVHLDETTPHMHLDFIPVATSERGLKTKISLDGALKSLGFERKNNDTFSETPYKRWLADRRKRFEIMASEYATIEPSEPCVVPHQDPREYNAEKQKQQDFKGWVSGLKSNNPITVIQSANRIIANAESIKEMYIEEGKNYNMQAQKEIKKDKIANEKRAQELEIKDKKSREIYTHLLQEQERINLAKNNINKVISEHKKPLEEELQAERNAHNNTRKELEDAHRKIEDSEIENKILYEEIVALRTGGEFSAKDYFGKIK